MILGGGGGLSCHIHNVIQCHMSFTHEHVMLAHTGVQTCLVYPCIPLYTLNNLN